MLILAGRSSCVGKQLALAELRLVAARLLSKYRFSFATDVGMMEFEPNIKDQLTANPGKLELVFEHI
jgi:cytochrome P450